MPITLLHMTRDSRRRLRGGLLVFLYLLIALAPLAPIALHSKAVAHGVTGECSGDCTICGCSPESRLARTCCCAKKKQSSSLHLTESGSISITSKEETGPGQKGAGNKGACCKGKSSGGKNLHDNHVGKSGHAEVVIKCGCPCSNGKQFALSGVSLELLPASPVTYGVPGFVLLKRTTFAQHMKSRHDDPPDLPPKLSPVTC
jgi:hypothetical protein